MSAVISFFRPAPATRGYWSQQELAEFYRVEAALIQAGMRITSACGSSDEDDPWFVFLRGDGDTIMHFARIDGRYVIASWMLDAPVRGPDFRALLDQLVAQYPTLLPIPRANSGARLVIHPAALLAAIIASAAFSLFSEDALANELASDRFEAASGADAKDVTAPASTLDVPPPPSPPKAEFPRDGSEDENRRQVNTIISAMLIAEGAFAFADLTHKLASDLLSTDQAGEAAPHAARTDPLVQASASAVERGDPRGHAAEVASALRPDAAFGGPQPNDGASGVAAWVRPIQVTPTLHDFGSMTSASLLQFLELSPGNLGATQASEVGSSVALVRGPHADKSSAPTSADVPSTSTTQGGSTDAGSTAASSTKPITAPEHRDGVGVATAAVPSASASAIAPAPVNSHQASSDLPSATSNTKASSTVVQSLSTEVGAAITPVQARAENGVSSDKSAAGSSTAGLSSGAATSTTSSAAGVSALMVAPVKVAASVIEESAAIISPNAPTPIAKEIGAVVSTTLGAPASSDSSTVHSAPEAVSSVAAVTSTNTAAPAKVVMPAPIASDDHSASASLPATTTPVAAASGTATIVPVKAAVATVTDTSATLVTTTTGAASVQHPISTVTASEPTPGSADAATIGAASGVLPTTATGTVVQTVATPPASTVSSALPVASTASLASDFHSASASDALGSAATPAIASSTTSSSVVPSPNETGSGVQTTAGPLEPINGSSVSIAFATDPTGALHRVEISSVAGSTATASAAAPSTETGSVVLAAAQPPAPADSTTAHATPTEPGEALLQVETSNAAGSIAKASAAASSTEAESVAPSAVQPPAPVDGPTSHATPTEPAEALHRVEIRSVAGSTATASAAASSTEAESVVPSAAQPPAPVDGPASHAIPTDPAEALHRGETGNAAESTASKTDQISTSLGTAEKLPMLAKPASRGGDPIAAVSADGNLIFGTDARHDNQVNAGMEAGPQDAHANTKLVGLSNDSHVDYLELM